MVCALGRQGVDPPVRFGEHSPSAESLILKMSFSSDNWLSWPGTTKTVSAVGRHPIDIRTPFPTRSLQTEASSHTHLQNH